ncbi:hypothetical protein [Breoghania sp. L-A4]|uniref:hypothetical protein n=1 Tax=Breoghania sp. L-A4 TaxID=2304600 RepID=UPI000E35C647|nr:hypothetical protein [Breoghania sp. L-A4]AXS39702.1 hypothetical protein D1F64_06125 [Breoghania sp. L-A4]
MVDLSRRQVFGVALALPAACPADRIAFHARALKDALDAATCQPGSRWCFVMAGRAGEPCEMLEAKRFDRSAAGETSTLILPRESKSKFARIRI